MIFYWSRSCTRLCLKLSKYNHREHFDSWLETSGDFHIRKMVSRRDFISISLLMVRTESRKLPWNRNRKQMKKWEGGHGEINESFYACVGFLLKPLRTYWRQFWWLLSWLMIAKSLIKSFIMISQPIYSEINRSRYIFLCWDGSTISQQSEER